MIFRRCYITHKPARELPPNAELNLFGHLHNIWDGFHANDPKANDFETYISREGHLWHPWQRLFAIEYTNYCPVEFDKFVNHPEKFKAMGPNGKKHFSLLNKKEREKQNDILNKMPTPPDIPSVRQADGDTDTSSL